MRVAKTNTASTAKIHAEAVLGKHNAGEDPHRPQKDLRTTVYQGSWRRCREEREPRPDACGCEVGVDAHAISETDRLFGASRNVLDCFLMRAVMYQPVGGDDMNPERHGPQAIEHGGSAGPMPDHARQMQPRAKKQDPSYPGGCVNGDAQFS